MICVSFQNQTQRSEFEPRRGHSQDPRFAEAHCESHFSVRPRVRRLVAETLRLRYHQGRYLQTLEMWFSNRSCALVFIIVPSRRVCGHRSNTRSLWETQCWLSKPSSGFGICNENVPSKNRQQNARCLAFVKTNAVCVRLRTIQREFFIRQSFLF